MSRFKLWKSEKDGQWYWSLVANNNEVIAQSEGYRRKESALKGIRAVRKAVFARVVE
jgi:uncharacterized protein YegP (UPF0339 family)